MSQKYIASGMGFNETWMDMRRYHYTDIDPASGRQVYPGFVLPTTTLYGETQQAVQRIRPRYNSEYVWNCIAQDDCGDVATITPSRLIINRNDHEKLTSIACCC